MLNWVLNTLLIAVLKVRVLLSIVTKEASFGLDKMFWSITKYSQNYLVELGTRVYMKMIEVVWEQDAKNEFSSNLKMNSCFKSNAKFQLKFQLQVVCM